MTKEELIEQMANGYTTLPYIMHVSLVAMEIIAALSVEQVYNPDLAVQVALLHDTIEDTDVTYDDVKERFGSDVANGATGLDLTYYRPLRIINGELP
jgi:(p)ppGpp synthase/HD superfamily hydrolase